MFILKHLKKLQTCFDLIQVILRELIYSLLKLLILKFVKKCKTLVWLCGNITYGVCTCALF